MKASGAARKPTPLVLAVNNSHSGIRFIRDQVLSGRNIHHESTVIRQRIDLGTLANKRTADAGADFTQRFLTRFQRLETIYPAGPLSDAFVQRLHDPEGASFSETLFEAILAVDAATAFVMRHFDNQGYSERIQARRTGVWNFVRECTTPRVSRLSASAAAIGLTELLPDELCANMRITGEQLDFATLMPKLLKICRRRQRSSNASTLILSARQRGLPCDIIGGSYLRLGHGFAQRIIHSSYAGESAANIPTPPRTGGSPYNNELTSDKAQQITRVGDTSVAQQVAARYGFPVVLTPPKGRCVAGVKSWARSPDALQSAFDVARREGLQANLAKRIPGQLHRLLIVNEQCVAALRIDPPMLIGDGRQSIRALISRLNEDPHRNDIQQQKIGLDRHLESYLAEAGYRMDDIPAAGWSLRLNCAGDISTGAATTDVTELVHADNQLVAIRAARDANLAVAGVDFVTRDIRQSCASIGGSVIEVHARPELAPHLWPRHGDARDVGAAVLDLAFSADHPGTIPTALITGGRGRARIIDEVEQLFRGSNIKVGCATRKKTRLDGVPLSPDTSDRKDAIRFLLHDPRCDAAVGETTTKNILKRGLRIENCNVSAILEPLPSEPAEVYRQGLAVQLEATTGHIIVGPTNSIANEILAHTEKSRIIMLSTQRRDPAIRRHLAGGGCAIVRERRKGRDRIVIKRNGEIQFSAPTIVRPDNESEQTWLRRLHDRMYAFGIGFGLGLASSIVIDGGR